MPLETTERPSKELLQQAGHRPWRTHTAPAYHTRNRVPPRVPRPQSHRAVLHSALLALFDGPRTSPLL